MDPKIINYIKDHPGEANALAGQWQTFLTTYSRSNPEILDIKSREEFNAWAVHHPEKHIDTNILWIGKEITDTLFHLTRQQEDKNKTTANETQSQEKEGRAQSPSISARDINQIIKSAEQPQPTTPTTTRQPSIQTPTRGFFNRTAIKTPARLGGRLAGRTGSMAGRLVSRLAVQAGMAAGRAVVAGLVSNPVGWIVIGVIVLIIVIVFFIIFFAGGGGGSSPVPTTECIDADGNIIIVTNGNTCAINLTNYYTNTEGAPVSATCKDKCTNFVDATCDRDQNNTCDPLSITCFATNAAFCYEYTPPDATLNRYRDCITGGSGYDGSVGGVNSCSGGIANPTATLAPTP